MAKHAADCLGSLNVLAFVGYIPPKSVRLPVTCDTVRSMGTVVDKKP